MSTITMPNNSLLPEINSNINTNQIKPELKINFAEVIYLPKEQTKPFIQSNVTPITLSFNNPRWKFLHAKSNNPNGNVAQKIALFNAKSNHSNEKVRSRGNVARKIELFNAKAHPNKSLNDRILLK